MTDLEESLSDAEATYGKLVGNRLRTIRRQKRMSLQDVEAESGQEFKASVLGAYERGERAISIPRLQRLAAFYSVPVNQLLPRGVAEVGERQETRTGHKVTIDLHVLDDLDHDERGMLTRYLSTIQMQRQDFNGRMLTIRHDDLRALACILDRDVENVLDTLDDLGLRLQ